MDPITASLLQSGANAGGNIISTAMTNRANKKMAEYAYSKDLEMWQRQNEYNNPASQMTRLKNAGLNPNLVYGSGQTVGNTASQLPKYQAPKMDYNIQAPGILEQLNAYQDLKVKQAQTDNIQSQTEIAKQEAIIRTVEAGWQKEFGRDRQYNLAEGESYETQRKKHGIDKEIFQARQDEYRANILKQTLDSQILSWQQNAKTSRINADIKDRELQFYKSGGKFFNPIIQGASLFIK